MPKLLSLPSSYSNTTFVKVKWGKYIPVSQVKDIQIQHLLKLNTDYINQQNNNQVIQIQHLLKLNQTKLVWLVSYLVIQIQHLLKLNK